MAVIESGLITEFYNQYRRNQNRSRDIEAGLVKASDRSIWGEKLAEKSEFLFDFVKANGPGDGVSGPFWLCDPTKKDGTAAELTRWDFEQSTWRGIFEPSM